MSTIASTLEFATNFATVATAAATGGREFLAVLERISAEAKTFDKVGAQMASIARAQIAADARVEAQRVKGAQQAEQQAAKLAAQAEQQAQKLAAQDAAQKNAAMARLIQAQVAGAQQVAAIEARAAVEAEKAAAAWAKAAGEESKAAAAIAKAAGTVTGKPASSPGVPAPSIPGLDGSAGVGILGELLNGGGLRSLFGAAGLGEMAGPLAAAADKLLSAAEAIASALAGLVVAGSKIAIDAGAFRETTEIAFEGFLGGAEAAAALYEKALDLSDKIGLDNEKVVAKISALLTAGFGEADALEAVKVVADLTQVRGEAAGNKLNAVLMKIQAADKIDVRNISALRSIGIQTTEVYAKIGEALGKTAKEAEALVKTGQVSADVGVKAIEAVVEKTFGGLAEKAGKTIPRLLGDIEDEAKRLFDKIDTGPIKGFLSNVSAALTGPSGERLRGSLERFFGSVFKAVFGPFEGEDGAAKIENVLEVISRALDNGADAAERSAPALAAVVRILDLIGGKNEDAARTADTLGRVVEVLRALESMDLGALLGIGLDLGIGLADLLGLNDVVPALQAMKAEIEAFFNGFSLASIWAELTGQGQTAGGSLVDGIVQGITSGASRILDAVTSLASSMVGGFKGALKIKSPSEVFADISEDVPEGMALGIERNAHKATGAARAMALSAAASAAAGLGSAGGAPANAQGRSLAGTASTGRGEGVTGPAHTTATQRPAIHIENLVVHAGTEEQGREAARGFWDEIRRLSEAA